MSITKKNGNIEIAVSNPIKTSSGYKVELTAIPRRGSATIYFYVENGGLVAYIETFYVRDKKAGVGSALLKVATEFSAGKNASVIRAVLSSDIVRDELEASKKLLSRLGYKCAKNDTWEKKF